MKVSIIIPVYNEFASLPEVLERVTRAPLPAGCEKEIIVVDDGSTDGTTRLLKQYRGSEFIVIHHSVLNFGKGTAVRVGLAMATGDIILIQDGDLEYDPGDYLKLLEPLISGEADVVYGSRFMRGPKNMRWANWLANKLLTTASNLLFQAAITDEATAYKAFRRNVVQSVSLNCQRFEFCPEVTAKLRRLGYEIKEVPISYNARGVSEGKKIKARDGFEALWTLVKYRILPVHGTNASKRDAIPRKRLSPGAPAVVLSCLVPLLLWAYLRSEAGHRLPWPQILASYLSATATLARHLPEAGWLLPRYALQSCAITLGILFTDFAFGAWLISLVSRRTCRRLPPVLSAAASLALGSGTAGTIIFLLASLHALTSSAVLALTACMGLVGVVGLYATRSWRSASRFVLAFRFPAAWPRHTRIALVALGLVLSPLIVLHILDLMVPVIESDSTMYHMVAAKMYKETHAIPFNGGIRFDAEPQLPVLLYLRHWLILGDDALLKLANLEFLLTITLVILHASRRVRWKEGSVIGLLFLGASPSFLWIAKIEYADLVLSAYFAVGVVLLCEQLAKPKGGYVWLTGATLGFVAASKFQGMVLVAMALLAFAVCWLVARMSLGALIRRAILMSVFIIMAGGGWWVRSYLSTGTPLYPFFGSGDLAADQTALLAHTQTLGLGHSLITLAVMPYSVVTVTSYRFGDVFGLGIPPLLFVCTLVLAGLAFRKAVFFPIRCVAFLVITLGGYFLFWFYSAQVLRYLATLLPVAAVALIVALRTMGVRRFAVVVVLCLTVLTVHSSLMTSTVLRCALMPPVTFQQKEHFLASTLPFYGATKALNASAGEDERVYALFAETSRYYLRADSYGDWFGQYSYGWLSGNGSSLNDVVSKLRAAGFTYVLLNRESMRQQGSSLFSSASDALASGHSLSGMRLVYVDDSYGAYRIE